MKRRWIALSAAAGVAAATFLAGPGAVGAPVRLPSVVLQGEDWVPSQIQPTKFPLRWSRATLNDKVTLDKFGRRPMVDPEHVTWLLACERDDQLDCVESIGLVSETGEYSPGKWVEGRTFDTEGRPAEGIAPYSMHQTIWEIPGLIINGKPAKIRYTGGLAGPGTLGTPGLNTDVELWDVDLIPSTPDSIRGCYFKDGDRCVTLPDFPDDARLRIVLRTSWLAPSGVMGHGKNVTMHVEDLGGGAHRWTLTGDPILMQSRGGRLDVLQGYANWVASTFYFRMIDPRLTGRPESGCEIFRPILFIGNASNLDMPRWKDWEGRLDLSMMSPHYWPDRQTEWRGYYETSIPEETARCLWGVDPRVTSYLSVEVRDENGQEKAATTSIGVTDGYVQVRAYDFTFSENTVSAKVNVTAGKRCFAQGVKITDLVCTKKGKKLVWARAGR